MANSFTLLWNDCPVPSNLAGCQALARDPDVACELWNVWCCTDAIVTDLLDETDLSEMDMIEIAEIINDPAWLDTVPEFANTPAFIRAHADRLAIEISA